MTTLFDPFPREAVSWRAQSLSKLGDKAMALAYIDARDVMNRLDDVCGPFGWQDSYTETASGRVICTIQIKDPEWGQWTAKSDGAGSTDVEGDKGGISDAFKRAAVKWGIGRYLYDLDAPWVPCESYEASNGKKVWKRWTSDPWGHVKNAPKVQKAEMPEGPCRTSTDLRDAMTACCVHIGALSNSEDLETYITEMTPLLAQHRAFHGRDSEHVKAIAVQNTNARARVAAREGLPAGVGAVPLEAEHVWSETTVRLVQQAQACSSTNGLNAWKREAKTMLDTLDAVEAAYVRGAVNDKAAALKAAEITAAG